MLEMQVSPIYSFFWINIKEMLFANVNIKRDEADSNAICCLNARADIFTTLF